jgi:L-alanine-DL-glutamate epimerase-like enolase superfamily enzyme
MREHIEKTLIGRDVDDLEGALIALNTCMVKNTSAKAAADMALYDLYGQLYKMPVYKLLGGGKNRISTDITISVTIHLGDAACRELRIDLGGNFLVGKVRRPPRAR